MKKVIIGGVEYVPKGEKEEIKERPFPQMGDEYWTLLEGNKKHMDTFDGHFLDLARQKVGNIFRTEKEAEQEALRRECMATRWVPEVGQRLYSFDFFDHKITQINQAFKKELFGYGAEVILGLARPTESEAKARWDMYGDAWLDALESKK